MALREHLALLMICLLYMVGGDVLAYYAAQTYPEFDYYTLTTILVYILQFYYAAGISIVTFLSLYLIAHTFKNYRVRPFWRQLVGGFKDKFLSPQQIQGLIVIFLLLPLFFAFIAMYKQLIPFVKPFSWDRTFMQWDYVLHFHHHPWELLQPLVGYSKMTVFLSRVYALWFILLAGIIIWQATCTQRFFRLQFFLTFQLVWIILGTLLAYCFSSAGPCFYHVYVNDVDPYAPLMSYLSHNAPAWLITLQNALLNNLENNTLIFGGGVSAMPSMHISMATLCFLISTKHNKWLSVFTFIFLIAIFIGSVHLGWHYAVDGYVAIILTVVIWYGVGKLLLYTQQRSLG